MKLLIVEDSALISSRLRVALADIMFLEKVVVADSYTDAVARFRQLLPEVAILDIQLPGGSGIELLRLIKEERPDTRVLMFSNHPYYRDFCEKAGAEAFYDKSADFEAITGRLRRLAGELRP